MIIWYATNVFMDNKITFLGCWQNSTVDKWTCEGVKNICIMVNTNSPCLEFDRDEP